MNDVESWMSPECLHEYRQLVQEADELDKGKGKNKGSAAKPTGKRKGKGPRQRAQQLKKQRFNKIVSDLANKKGFFMTFVRHPQSMSVTGIMDLLKDLQTVMHNWEYKDIVKDSAKKNEEDTRRK